MGKLKVSDTIHLEGNAQASVALTTSGAQSGVLTQGDYDVWASTDCYLKVDTTASNVTTATGYLLQAGNIVTLSVREGRKLGAVVSAGTSTLYYHKVGD